MANEQKKKIYFCIDTESYTKQMVNNRGAVGYYDYRQAKHGMNIGVTPIVTSQLALMSFDQIGDYESYICYKDKAIKIEVGMKLDEYNRLSVPSCCEDSDILDVFLMGYFDEMLGIK